MTEKQSKWKYIWKMSMHLNIKKNNNQKIKNSLSSNNQHENYKKL